MSVWRLPHILIIQLKRFSYNYDLSPRKIDTPVQYPVKALNLQPYMPVEPEDGPPIYDLYGVINHIGEAGDGHYNAYARLLSAHDNNIPEVNWRFFDDIQVSSTSESNVVNQKAYLLLYRRRGTNPLSLPGPLTPPLPGTHTPEENYSDLEI